MKILLLVIVGYGIGYALGWIVENTTKKVDGKQEVNDYMEKTYGENWWKINLVVNFISITFALTN